MAHIEIPGISQQQLDEALAMLRAMVQILRDADAFAPDAKLYLSHIAPSLHRLHEEIVRQVAAGGL